MRRDEIVHRAKLAWRDIEACLLIRPISGHLFQVPVVLLVGLHYVIDAFP